MSTDSNRRDFLKVTAAAGAALGLGVPVGACAGPAATPQASGSGGKLLILGGTGFIGPYQVRSALAQGLEVTIFNRGNRPGLFEGVEELVGDRNGDFESLRGRTWDVVIDNSTARPDWVTSIGEFLRDSVEYFYYVSSRSAYADHSTVPMTAAVPSYTYETAGVDRATADITDLPYGLAKAESEREAMRIFPDRYGIFRPGLIIGPDDPTDRFTYWPVRVHHGGEVIAPGDMDNPVQFIDVRDLAEFCMHLLEEDTGGIFNVAGPTLDGTRMDEFLYGISAVTTSRVSFTWVDEAFLRNREPPARFPLWYSHRGPTRGLAQVRSHRGVEAGLRFRPLAVTARETLDWFLGEPEERREQLQLNLDRDAEILADWKNA